MAKKNKVNKKDVARIWKHWEDEDLLEDRREYSVSDIESSYQINRATALVLYRRVQRWAHR